MLLVPVKYLNSFDQAMWKMEAVTRKTGNQGIS
jgi:hypothetical protein